MPDQCSTPVPDGQMPVPALPPCRPPHLVLMPDHAPRARPCSTPGKPLYPALIPSLPRLIFAMCPFYTNFAALFVYLPDMTDLSKFDTSGPSNPKNNIFGLPFTEDEATLVILPIPWEVTVSY